MAPGWRLVRPGNPDIERAQTDFTDGKYVLQMLVDIDRKTQDILVQISGGGSQEGLIGAGWGIQGMDIEAGRLIIPANGGCVWDSSSPITRTQFDYPRQWEAGMVVWESRAGGLVVYTRDNKAHHKRLTVARRRNRLEMALETHAFGPHNNNSQLPDMFWRINTFKGDWRVPTDGYRRLAEFLRPSVTGQGLRTWTRGIQSVVTLAQRDFDPGIPLKLALRLQPATTVLYLLDWRKDPFGVNLPDYTPSESAKEFIRLAKLNGYHVMLHMDAMAGSPSNPSARAFRAFQVRDSDTGTLAQKPDGFELPMPSDTILINPGVQAWREVILKETDKLVQDLNIDAVMLGHAGSMWNDGNPKRAELKLAQGIERLQRELLIRLPSLAVGADSLNEWLLPHSSIVMPRVGGPLPAHPISAFLFRGTTFAFQSAALQAGFAEEARSVSAEESCLRTGIALSPVLWRIADIDFPSPVTRFAFEERKLAEKSALTPIFAGPDKDQLVFMGSSRETVARTWTATTMRQIRDGQIQLAWSSGAASISDPLAALSPLTRTTEHYGPMEFGHAARFIHGSRPANARQIPRLATVLPLLDGWTATSHAVGSKGVLTGVSAIADPGMLEAEFHGSLPWMDNRHIEGRSQLCLMVPMTAVGKAFEIPLELPLEPSLTLHLGALCETGIGNLKLTMNGKRLWETRLTGVTTRTQLDVSEFAGRRVRIGYEWDGFQPATLCKITYTSDLPKAETLPQLLGITDLGRTDVTSVHWLDTTLPAPIEPDVSFTNVKWTEIAAIGSELLSNMKQEPVAAVQNSGVEFTVPAVGEFVRRAYIKVPIGATKLKLVTTGEGIHYSVRVNGKTIGKPALRGSAEKDVGPFAGQAVLLELAATCAEPRLGLTARWERVEIR